MNRRSFLAAIGKTLAALPFVGGLALRDDDLGRCGWGHLIGALDHPRDCPCLHLPYGRVMGWASDPRPVMDHREDAIPYWVDLEKGIVHLPEGGGPVQVSWGPIEEIRMFSINGRPCVRIPKP